MKPMAYCKYCGTEIRYKKTKNGAWLPCDAITGKAHLCLKEKESAKSGLVICGRCGRPIFRNHGKTFDYLTLSVHVCKKADIARYSKFKKIH